MSNPTLHPKPNQTLRATLKAYQEENAKLRKIIAKELAENDEFGAEFVLVGILRAQLEKAMETLELVKNIGGPMGEMARKTIEGMGGK